MKLIDIEKIQAVKHVQIVADADSFANASALYSYILTLHKKVSLCVEKELDRKLSFLPWYEKARKTEASSSEYTIVTSNDTVLLYEFFVLNTIKLNAKMATALYSGLLLRYDNLVNVQEAKVFDVASDLLCKNADVTTAREFLQRRVPLSEIRLRAKMYDQMILCESATRAEFYLSEKLFKSIGSTLEVAFIIAKESLNIVHVNEVRLIDSDNNNKIIKQIKEV